MNIERRHSSGVAKAGLTTGIIGTTLGALGVLGAGANGVGSLLGSNGNGGGTTMVTNGFPYGAWGFPYGGFGWGYGAGFTMPVVPVANVGTCNTGCCNQGCGCNEDHIVNRYELQQENKIAELQSQISLRDANTFTDQKMLEMYKYVDGKITNIEAVLAQQAVKNQATADSFNQIGERVNCVERNLSDKICDEREARRCADNLIVTYANSTFYPKQVANVTVGTEMTSQAVYNPLPMCDCNCGGC